MTSQKELAELIEWAEAQGAKVTAATSCGLICSIRVAGLTGCGPYPMAPIAFAERLRELRAAAAKAEFDYFFPITGGVNTPIA